MCPEELLVHREHRGAKNLISTAVLIQAITVTPKVQIALMGLLAELDRYDLLV